MKRFIYCMALFAMVLYSCNQSASKQIQDNQLSRTEKNIADNDQIKNENQTTADTVYEPTQTVANSSTSYNTDWDKKIIKTADLELQLDDYKKFNTSFHNSLKIFGAYIAGERQQQTDYKMENSITVKVPVAQFDDLVNSLSGEGIRIINKNITGEDVTGEVIDTKARLQSKLAVREQYLMLLKQAKNMKDILTVQNEINEIQENIEAANSRITYLQHTAAYSSININYYQFINGSQGDEQPTFFTKISDAFLNGLTALSDLVVFLINIWPFTLGIIVFWIYVKKFRLKKVEHSK